MKQLRMKSALYKWQTKKTRHYKNDAVAVCHRIINQTCMVAILLVSSLVFACSPQNAQQYRNTDEALGDYRNFLHKIENDKKMRIDNLLDLAQNWLVLRDSVSSCFKRDTTGYGNYHADSLYKILSDSIQIEFERLIDEVPRTFNDYRFTLDRLSEPRFDGNIQGLVVSAQSFFRAMDSVRLSEIGKKETVSVYENTLNRSLAHPIQSKQDILDYLKKEDVSFRLFLLHLHSWGDMPLSNIKEKTELQAKRIFEAATQANPVMDKSEVVILMTMRNNRRLLQNASTCIDDLSRITFNEPNQATAYLWMLLQPWLSIDGFAYTLLVQKEKETMAQLADKMPYVFTKLKAGRFPIRTEELPSLLMKAYFSNL